ncbi:MAG: HEAT repeat domain-containing protein [Anaerolineae bacterium]|nr:HEAT repeat domain-containing protein [Anaerolineae bacterium]MDW8098298.1 HEAT repeat domain-containing protein [Anaerolineae bacterium]
MGLITRLRNWRRNRSVAPSFEGDPFAALADTRPRRRWEAAAALRDQSLAEQAIIALTQALADPEPFVRWEAGQSLIALGTEEAIQALSESLRDPSPRRRAAAAEALGQPGWVQVLPLLTAVLVDRDPGVRVAAALAIGRIGHPLGIPHLAACLEREPSAGVRWVIARALGMIGDPAAVSPLRQCLAALWEPAPVRRSAAWALGQLGWDAGAVEGLLAALSDPDPQVRWHACLGIGNVIQAALRARQADHELVARAREALSQLWKDGADAGFGLVGEAAVQALTQINAALRSRRLIRLRPQTMER